MTLDQDESTLMMGKQLHSVDRGRIFVREGGDGGIAIVGIVELPVDLEPEHFIQARLNERLWVDMDYKVDPLIREGIRGRQGLAEMHANHLFTALKFAQGALPDAVELFTRRTLMEHSNYDMCWSIVMGVTRNRLSATPKDGLYEINPHGEMSYIDSKIYRGYGVGSVLEEPLWGEGGKFGLYTSMEPMNFPVWLIKARAESERRDPKFARFSRRMEELLPMRMVLTREQMNERKRTASQVLNELSEGPTDAPHREKMRA